MTLDRIKYREAGFFPASRYFFALSGIAVVKKEIEHQTKPLHDAGADQQHPAGFENVGIELEQTGFENVAGDDDIDAQVGEAAFAFLVDHALLLQDGTHQHHREQRQLQAAKIQNTHDIGLLAFLLLGYTENHRL